MNTFKYNVRQLNNSKIDGGGTVPLDSPQYKLNIIQMEQIFEEAPEGYKYVFCRYIRRKDGTIMYPKKSEFFRFPVKK